VGRGLIGVGDERVKFGLDDDFFGGGDFGLVLVRLRGLVESDFAGTGDGGFGSGG
jgi:hypothetical protein